MPSRARTFFHRSLIRSFLAATALCALNVPLHAQEVCDNAVDDDADGLIDLNDSTDCICDMSTGLGGPVTPLIANTSFEAYSSLPNWFSQFDRCDSWELGTGGSSDYFLAPSYMPSGVPQPLPDGNACAGGFIIRDNQGPGVHYLEYIATCLSQPMQSGEQYSLQFHVAGVMLDLFTYGAVPMSLGPVDITVYGLSTCVPFPVGTGFGCPQGWTVLGQLSYQPTGAWDQVTITFTPPTDINAIMIGGPCQPPADYTGVATAPYFFYDAFTLNDSTSLGASVTRTGSTCTNDVILHGHANGTATGYQWYHEGVALVGQTDSLLHLSDLGLGAGMYQFRPSALGGDCAVAAYLLEADPYPVLAATATPTAGCVPLQVSFAHGADPALVGTTSWDLGDGSTSADTVPEHTYTTAGIFDVALTVTSPQGCVADTTYTAMVEAYAPPSADFVSSPQPTDLFRTDISFVDASSADVVQWAWDFGPGGMPGTSDEQFPHVHFPGVAGTYPVQLVVTNVHGCTDTIMHAVVINGYHAVYVPNAFTPNGDGVNDTWIPRITDQDERLYQVRVFDRWGEEIWASTDPLKGWDGMLGGELLKTDVFVWKMETREANSSVRHLYLGHVSLLK